MGIRPSPERPRLGRRLATLLALLFAALALSITPALAQQPPGLAATVDPADWSVDLTLSNGPQNRWFRIGSGTCTAAASTTVSNIRGYAAG